MLKNAILFLSCFTLVHLQADETPSKEAQQNGRYQISAIYNHYWREPEIFLVDTQTGKAWATYRNGSYDEWRPLPPLPTEEIIR